MPELNDRGAEMLSAAVVVQAVRDWVHWRHVIDQDKGTRYYLDGEVVACPAELLDGIERFIRSRWFGVLCEYDGELLLEHLRRENPKKIVLGTAEKKKQGKPSIHWRRLDRYPELQRKLRDHHIMQSDISTELGITYASLINWLRYTISEDRLRMIEAAADAIIKRRATNENCVG